MQAVAPEYKMWTYQPDDCGKVIFLKLRIKMLGLHLLLKQIVICCQGDIMEKARELQEVRVIDVRN